MAIKEINKKDKKEKRGRKRRKIGKRFQPNWKIYVLIVPYMAFILLIYIYMDIFIQKKFFFNFSILCRKAKKINVLIFCFVICVAVV